MIHTIHITPTTTTTTTTQTTTTTTTTFSSIMSKQSLLRILFFAFITYLSLSSHHVIAEHAYPAIPSAQHHHQQGTSSMTHPPLPSTSTYPPLSTTEPENPVADINEQYNTSVATPTPKITSKHSSPSSHASKDIAWATVIYDSTSTSTLSVHDQSNQTHPNVHVRHDELHGQYGASTNPVLLRETAEYEKQKLAKAAMKQKQHVDPELGILAEQYGVVTPKTKAEDKEIPDLHTLAEDEINGKISIETKLIANGTWVLPNIIEKDAAKWTDSGYGSSSADAIKADTEADDTPLQQIFKDEETRAAAVAAVSEIVSLEALELAELSSRTAELEASLLQSYQDAQHDAQRSSDTELLDEILRENAYVRHSKKIIEKQLAREQYLHEQARMNKVHELEELNHQHVIGNDHMSRSEPPQDEMHGQYGIIANPDIISAQAEEREKAALPPIYAAPPANHGVEYGDKYVPTHASYETTQDTIITPHMDEDEKDRRPSQETYGLANGSIPFMNVDETKEAVLTDSEYGSSVETLSSGDNVIHVPPMERVTPTITSYEPRTNPEMKQWESQDMIIPQHNTISQAFPNIASQEEPITTPAPIQVDEIVATPIRPEDAAPTYTPPMDDIPSSHDDSPHMLPFALKDISQLAHEADMQASEDPFSNIPSFSLSQHLQTLINNEEMEFAAMTYTGGYYPTPTPKATPKPTGTPKPTSPPYHYYASVVPDISTAEIPAPSTARIYFNYTGLWPDTIITPNVNISVIATTFRIKCIPSNTKGGTLGTITVDGLTSPIEITGFDGTVAYTCTPAVITPAYGLQWGKNWNKPIQTGQQRVTLRVLIPYNQTCGGPKVSQFYVSFQTSLVQAMHISPNELTIVSCLRDYQGMTLITVAFTFPEQYQIQSTHRIHIMSEDSVTSSPTTLTASQKRDLLQNLISNPDSSLYQGISYTQLIDNSYWSAEQRDLGRDVCTTNSACSGNDYCYNGYESTYQCQCDSTLSSRNCWNHAISCAAPPCLSGDHIARNMKPLPDCAIFTIPIVLNLATPVSSTESLRDQANDVITMLAQSTSQDPSVFEFIQFSNNTDGTSRIELNVLQNGNRSTSCIVQDIQYQQKDIRTVLMRAMDTQMGGLTTVLKQCDDGQYDEACDIAPAKPWYLFWIYVGVIILGCIFSLLILYFLALYACIHIFPEPMAAFIAKHRIPGVNEKKLHQLQQRKAAKRKAEAKANGIYDVKDLDLGDSCEESDFHSSASGDDYTIIQQTKVKKGEIAMIGGATYRPESARGDGKTPAVEPTQANTQKPKRFARWRKQSIPSKGLIVPVDSTGQVTDQPSPSHCMQVMDLSMPSDSHQQPTQQAHTTSVRSGFFGRKIITTRRASGFKMPEFSVIPLASGEKTPPELEESMVDTRTYGASLSQDGIPSRVASTSVSRMGPQSTAWIEPVSRISSASISRRSAPSVTDPRIMSSQPSNISQALAYAQTQLYDDIPTIDTTPVVSRIRSYTPPVLSPRSTNSTPRHPHGIRRRSSSIDNSIIGRVYSSDSDHEAIRPSRNTVSHMMIPTREDSISRTITPRSIISTPRSHIHIEQLPNGYHSGMESPHETSDYEYSQRSEYSHL